MASVNRPTNVKQKEQDINQKLQFYGIYSAFSNGKVPSNKQIDIALNSALKSRPLANPSSKLSSEGRHLVADLRDVIEKAKILLLTKNEGNLIQDFIWQCQMAGTGDANKPGMPVGKDTAKQHGNEALEGLKTLGSLIISNGQFRKLLNDGLTLLRDIAGDGAQKIAGKVNPNEEDLNRIDEPAEDNTWHENPDVGGLKDQMKSKIQQNKPFGKDGLKNAANDAQSSGQQQGSNRDAGIAGAKQGLSNLKDQATSNMPNENQDKAKDKANETKDRTKGYFKDKMPQERRDQTIYRLKKMIVEIQGHSDYQQAIDTLLRLAETYKGHSKSLAQDSVGQVKDAHNDDGLVQAEKDLKTLLERFADSTSMDDLFDSIDAIYKDADRDPELKRWFSSMDNYVRKCLKQQGFILEDKANEEWNKLYEKGEYLLRDRYKNHTDRIVDELNFFGKQFDNDPHNKAFADALQKLFNDLGTDENGKSTFKTHLVTDLTNVIIPGLFESIQYVPIPRIEYSDPMADAIIENLVVESDNLAPNVFEFGSDNYFRWGRKNFASKNKNKVMVSASGIQMDLKDVSYYVKKKEGFPSLSDTGVMDIFLGGTGLSFKMALETADKSDSAHFFKVNSVVVDIKNMNIKLKQSKHKLLFALVKPLLLKVMTPILTKVVEKMLKDNVQKLDAYVYSIKKEADKAAAEAKRNPDPQNIQNIYQQYWNAFQEKLQSNKEKGEKATQDKAVNVAVTKQDSMFKNISLPGGISTKATEYKNLAGQGSKWESPIFSIGSAGETTDLPSPKKISRKPHDTAPSEIRGEKNLEPKSTGHDGNDSYANDSSYGNESYGQQDSYGQGGYEDFSQTGYAQSGGLPAASYAQSSPQYDQGYASQQYGGYNGGVTTKASDLYEEGATHTTLGYQNPVLTGRV